MAQTGYTDQISKFIHIEGWTGYKCESFDEVDAQANLRISCPHRDRNKAEQNSRWVHVLFVEVYYIKL